MSKFYDRQGNPLDGFEWTRLFEKKEMQRVRETTLPDGKWISTVWIGLDHNFGPGNPLIFETMVFPKEHEWGQLDCERYSTEEQAIVGHDTMVEKWGSAQLPEDFR